MLPDFKLKKDWYITTSILGVKNRTLILSEGHTITPTKNGEYHIIYGGWSEDNPRVGGRMISDEEGMSNAVDEDGKSLFERIDHFDSELIIEEVSEDDDNQVKNWRIQLDVKTTRKKLKEIQRIFEEQIKPLVR
jgi:hypothetical protein